MTTAKSELTFSNLVLIKRVFYTATFPEEVTFEEICSRFQKPIFKPFRWAEQQIFSEHRRNIQEAIRTFEVYYCNNLKSLDLGKSEVYGQLRIFITLYRAGFAVLSIAYCFVPKSESEKVKEKTLYSSAPLTSKEVRTILDDQRFDEKTGKDIVLEYVINKGVDVLQVDFHAYLEHLLRKIEEQGLKIGRKMRPIRRTIYVQELEFQEKSIADIIQEYNKELFTIFTTATEAHLKRLSQKRRVEQLNSNLHKTSEYLGFIFDEVSMLVVARKKIAPHEVLRSQLVWIHQLVFMQEFLIIVYSSEVRRLAVALASAVESQYSNLFSELVKIREGFLLSLEDLYYVEGDLFRLQSEKLILEYKRLFGLDQKVKIIQKRLGSVKSRTQEALRAREQESLERREKSITTLSLIFATFGFGEIISVFIIWYFSSIVSNQNIDIAYLLGGLVLTSFSMISIFIISRWYINRNTSPKKSTAQLSE
jgi:hypothetical protein